jgi:ectoine hydroxylase-related dioxygenase (phytanoyl-CoA dioxygenase family)
MKHGYAVLEQAVDPELCDQVSRDLEEAWERSDGRILAQHPDGTYFDLDHGVPMDQVRALDVYAHQRAAREALLAPAIRRFLSIVFEEDALLFQSLSFHTGSEQAIHQDTAYVVTTDPMRLCASWIALEDVAEGSGELMYYEGSHRLPEFHFSDRFKHWSPDRDGAEQHERWGALLHENAVRMGMPLKHFRPRKGDVFIWSADLAHGGSPIQDRRLTRRSIVGHYTPGSAQPHYMSHHPSRTTRVPWNGFEYSSYHYDLGALGQPGQPPATVPERSLVGRPAPLRRLLSRLSGGRRG